jgi:pteridine reductase
MPEQKNLSGRVALVTGAAKRLGRHVALRLAQEGADVAVHYGKSAAAANDLVHEIERLGRRAASFQAELTNIAEINQLITSALTYFGRLDILINTAANFIETKFPETTEATWDASLDTNLKAPFFCCQAAAPHLARSVRVNAIAPGTITMPGDPPEWQQDYIRLAPLRRSGSPEEVADAVLYLIRAEFVTGHTLVLDGGRSL